MSLRQAWRALLAYLFASLVVIPVAWVGAIMCDAWGIYITAWEIFGALWLLTVGIPSMGWATSKLSRVLGVRPVPRVQLGRWRSIPIGGTGHVLADAGRSVLWAVGGATRSGKRSIDIPDELTFICGDYGFSEREALEFLRRAWSRQRMGKAALSRTYWVRGRGWDRARYDAMLETLCNLGIVTGRTAGASGRLVCPPLTAINDLKHALA